MNRKKVLASLVSVALAVIGMFALMSTSEATVHHPYVTVAWTMSSYVDATTPTWPQHYAAKAETDTPSLGALDETLTGCLYQVDVYKNDATTAALLAGGVLNGPNSPQESLIPGGWGVSYKIVHTDCPTPTPTPTLTPTLTPTPTLVPVSAPMAPTVVPQVVRVPKGGIQTGDGSTAVSP